MVPGRSSGCGMSAAAQLLTGKTAPAELDILAHEGNLLNIVSGAQRAFHEPISEHVAV